MSARVAVAGLGVSIPGFPSVASFMAREPQGMEPPPGTLLDKHSRRRASDLTKALADAYGEALAHAQLPPTTVASVFGSALGEVSTMISLLDQMWRETGALSPMRFATSVHNAAAGVVSIGTKNTGFTTSLGADYDTPAMALMEAMGIALASGEPVVVACGDEAAPSDLVGGAIGWGALCAAVALVPDEGAPGEWLRISAPEIMPASLPAPALPAPLASNPNAGLLDLIDAVTRGLTGTLRLDRGRGRGFAVTLSRTP
jgi:Beta-ketoacyl synthase, N-terminal domain